MPEPPPPPADTTGYVDSYYTATARSLRRHAPLAEDIEADVCVIGGGYTGVSTALHLAERGYSVALLEAERLGWGASGRNGGHVGVGQRRDQPALEKLLGAEHARRLWDLSLEAVALVRELVARHGIDCDLKDGIAHVAAKPAHAVELRAECEHLRTHYGYAGARYADREETAAMVGTTRYHGARIDDGAAHLHPLNYLLGLAAAAAARGVRLFEGSRVRGFTRAAPHHIETAGGTVQARHLVIACNGYLDKLDARLAAKIMPINNFILATEPLGEETARSLIRDDIAVADTLFVVNYWKLSGDNRLLFGGGENYTRRFPRDISDFVRRFMLRVYPQLESTRIDYAWGGTLAVTMNRLPSVGRCDDGSYYAQGFSGHGVPTATMAGKAMAEAIDGDRARFDLMAKIPVPRFPGGVLLRWPGLVAGMAYYALLDKL